MEENRRRICANFYLDMIVNACRLGVPITLRNFLDPWSAYHTGGDLLTRDGNPHTFNNPCPYEHRSRLRKMDWVSREAEHILGQAEHLRKKNRSKGDTTHQMIVDHAVPLIVLERIIRSNPALWERAQLQDFLLANYKRGVLTYCQNQKLRAARLNQGMPLGWTPSTRPFARYEELNFEQHVYP